MAGNWGNSRIMNNLDFGSDIQHTLFNEVTLTFIPRLEPFNKFRFHFNPER